MAKIVSFNAFRHGTGKSNLVADLATLLALEGRRVGVVDLDDSAPTMHIIFGLPESEVTLALSDYLAGRCQAQQTAHDVTPQDAQRAGGRVFLVPLSIEPGWMPMALRKGLDLDVLSGGLRDLMHALTLDLLLIDCNNGLNELSLASLAMSDAAVLVLRLDKQDYQGTAVTVDLARRLSVPRLMLVVNMIPPGFDPAAVRAKVAETYGCDVAAVLPYSDRLSARRAAGPFVLENLEDPATAALRHVAEELTR